MSDKEYNGHKNWDYWNVSLWINNDEPMYRRAYELVTEYGVDTAAGILFSEFPEHTPDGAAYTVDSIKEAISDILG